VFAKKIKWIFLILLSLIWGSSFILIKKGLIGQTPLQLGSLRIIFAAVFLLAIGHKTLLKIPQNQWKFIVLTAFFGTFIPAYLFAIAETQLDSSITAILNSLTPLNTLVLGVLAFGLGVQRNQIMGVVIGLAGSALLILSGANNHPEQNYYYAFLVIIASICYAANVNLIKKYLSDLSPLTISTGNFTVLLLPSLIVLFSTGFSRVWSTESVQNAMVYILILGVIGTGVANILFFKLIQISSPVFATSVTYLIPIVAFFWGLLDHEKLTPIQYMGAFIILIGVYISSKKKG
jgi:drug/metabolite transporter (DMT)-like permease